MKIFFSTVRNPHFATITEYVERALRGTASEVSFFDDRDFILPGRLHKGPLARLDLSLLNRRLRSALERERPDVMLECGGERVEPASVEFARRIGVKTVLWTIDAVKDFPDPRLNNAAAYDYVFCGGTEMLHYLQGRQLRRPAQWLPFGCDPELHAPAPTGNGAAQGAQAVFVGSLHRDLYPRRLALLEEAAAACRLGLWGPGADKLLPPLKNCVRGGETTPEQWRKIYSDAPITLCLHYQDPAGKLVCNQASPRVFEALACGAFVLCDSQPDVMTLFEDGKHMAFFSSPGGLREKIAYYLAHEEERKAIAGAGRAEALARHTYACRVKKILDTAVAG